MYRYGRPSTFGKAFAGLSVRRITKDAAICRHLLRPSVAQLGEDCVHDHAGPHGQRSKKQVPPAFAPDSALC
jgi:hypothetical protein